MGLLYGASSRSRGREQSQLCVIDIKMFFLRVVPPPRQHSALLCFVIESSAARSAAKLDPLALPNSIPFLSL